MKHRKGKKVCSDFLTIWLGFLLNHAPTVFYMSKIALLVVRLLLQKLHMLRIASPEVDWLLSLEAQVHPSLFVCCLDGHDCYSLLQLFCPTLSTIQSTRHTSSLSLFADKFRRDDDVCVCLCVYVCAFVCCNMPGTTPEGGQGNQRWSRGTAMLKTDCRKFPCQRAMHSFLSYVSVTCVLLQPPCSPSH